MTALALTDRDTVAGAVRFANACAEQGVRPIFGVDLAVAPVAAPSPTARPVQRRTPVRGGAHVPVAPLRMTLLAQDRAGWAGLCRLVSAAHADTTASEGVPAVDWPTLHAFAGRGLTVLLGPASEPVRALSAGRPDVAERLLAPWRELFGGSLRLETETSSSEPYRFALVWKVTKSCGSDRLLAARSLDKSLSFATRSGSKPRVPPSHWKAPVNWLESSGGRRAPTSPAAPPAGTRDRWCRTRPGTPGWSYAVGARGCWRHVRAGSGTGSSRRRRSTGKGSGSGRT